MALSLNTGSFLPEFRRTRKWNNANFSTLIIPGLLHWMERCFFFLKLCVDGVTLLCFFFFLSTIGVCSELSCYHLGENPQPLWYICFWTFLGLGYEGFADPQLWAVLDYQHHLGAHWGRPPLIFITKRCEMWIVLGGSVNVARRMTCSQYRFTF